VPRRFDCRRVKIHRSYTVAELASKIGAHKQTVSRWIAAGLPTIDARRPYLIRGEDFRAFVKAREPLRQKCRPGEFYCVGCRIPKRPAGDMADYVPRTASRGSLVGICPTCGRMIYRAVTRAKIGEASGGLDIAYPHGEQRINEMVCALSHVDFKGHPKT
jgi:excisionase family DNA binding protein